MLLCEFFLAEEVFDFDPEKTRFLFDLDLKATSGSSSSEDRQEAVKTFAAWLRAHRDDVMRLYHATDAQHDVLGQGLLHTTTRRRRSIQSGSGYVYLAYDPNRAIRFAEMGYPRAKELAIYGVDVPIRLLRPDVDQLRNKRMWGSRGYEIGDDLASSFLFGGGARVKGSISPESVSLYWKGPRPN